MAKNEGKSKIDAWNKNKKQNSSQLSELNSNSSLKCSIISSAVSVSAHLFVYFDSTLVSMLAVDTKFISNMNMLFHHFSGACLGSAQVYELCFDSQMPHKRYLLCDRMGDCTEICDLLWAHVSIETKNRMCWIIKIII